MLEGALTQVKEQGAVHFDAGRGLRREKTPRRRYKYGIILLLSPDCHFKQHLCRAKECNNTHYMTKRPAGQIVLLTNRGIREAWWSLDDSSRYYMTITAVVSMNICRLGCALPWPHQTTQPLVKTDWMANEEINLIGISVRPEPPLLLLPAHGV